MKKCGFLVVCGMISPSDKGLLLTLEQAANVIAFELLKENALKQYLRRARNEFSEILDGAFPLLKKLKPSKRISAQVGSKYVCIAGKLDRRENRSASRKSA
ncbi:hypothetical protein PO124_07285 [Bacillus licheniformis]|nr:hypothetical protein [Bacillus licheniformis]